MVKNILLTAILLSSATAFADEGGDDDDDAGFNMLGMRFGFGTMPIDDGASSLTVSLGLGVEHPVFKRTRVFGEYEWLWLSSSPADPTALMNSEPEHNGSGHRAVLGLRRELVGVGKHSMHAFVDGEVGSGLAIANDSMYGLEILPTGFVGLRAGYDLYSNNDDSPSRTFELDLLLRVLVVPDGVGVMTGLGMAWGN